MPEIEAELSAERTREIALLRDIRASLLMIQALLSSIALHAGACRHSVVHAGECCNCGMQVSQ